MDRTEYIDQKHAQLQIKYGKVLTGLELAPAVVETISPVLDRLLALEKENQELWERKTLLRLAVADLSRENKELREQKAILRLALIKAGCYLVSDEVASLVAGVLETVPDDNVIPMDGQPWPCLDAELAEKGL